MELVLARCFNHMCAVFRLVTNKTDIDFLSVDLRFLQKDFNSDRSLGLGVVDEGQLVSVFNNLDVVVILFISPAYHSLALRTVFVYH